jgi:hypothetical protein
MNGVDRMDQYRSTLPKQREAKRLHMTIFTFILDLSIMQDYAIYQKKAFDKKDSQVSFFEFKRRICQSLIGGSQRN